MRRVHSRILDEVPQDIREELDQQLLDGMRIREAADWLADRGWPISKSAVGRYYLRHVRPLAAMFQRAEAFKAVLSEGGERPATELHEAANLLLTDRYLELLMGLGEDDQKDVKQLVSLAKGLSMVQSAAVANERLKTQQRGKLEAAFDVVMRDLSETLSDAHPRLLEQLEGIVAERKAELG